MKSSRNKVKSGQTMFEYILVFVELFGLLGAIHIFFVSAARSSAERTTQLVTCEYP